jgi:GT2 family glycosyltransferase
MEKVTVGIISHKPGEMLERCVRHLCNVKEYPAGVPFDVKLQLTEGSHAENWNRLMERCETDFVCVLEDDTAPLQPFWLATMLNVMERNPIAAIVMPIETKDAETKEPDPGFKKWRDVTVTVPVTYAFCNLVRRSCGLVADEKLNYFVDVDLALQSTSKGFVNIVSGHVLMLHGTQNGGRMSDDAEKRSRQRVDSAYMAQKWPGLWQPPEATE